MRPPRPAVLLLAALVVAPAAALAAPLRGGAGGGGVEGACQAGWLPTFGPVPGDLDGFATCYATFDDGTGPALYVGGSFASVDGVPAGNVARWDGAAWSAVGGGTDGGVGDLVVHDDGLGGGPALYAAGDFSTAGGVPAENVARWDGTAWSPLGTGTLGQVETLAVWDDGGGPDLYAGGTFIAAGGVPVGRVARWDGAAWSALGAGAGMNSIVQCLEVFDDGLGGGPALHAGGFFSTADGTAVNGIARWDGAAWSALGAGFGGPTIAPFDLAVFDDGLGGGAQLYAAGFFTMAGGAPAGRVARWDGAGWSALGSGLNQQAFALEVFDDGGGADLYVGGSFSTAGGLPASSVARWDGAAWSAVDDGTDGVVRGLAVHDDGGGAQLHAAGTFTGAGEVSAAKVARFDGTEWEPLGGGVNDPVQALAVWDDGGGADLYAGGEFTALDGVAAGRIGRWDGQAWSALGTGLDRQVRALAVYDDGGGADLYAGGAFQVAGGVAASRVARWDGAAWSPLGAGPSPDADVRALAVYDDGGGADLYAGGDFAFAGGVSVSRWDGAAWSALGAGTNGVVSALLVWDDGGGADLYAGGTFTTAGGAPAANVARWDGAAWSALGAGVDDTVRALAVYDDGGGADLYAAGAFATAGGAAIPFVARWDGASWTALGAGVNNSVETLLAFDDGSGAALFAGGRFVTAGGASATRLARWDGAAWSALGAGVSDVPRALAAFDDGLGLGSALVVGGDFLEAFDTGDGFLARWGGCGSYGRPATYCTGKTTSGGCVPFVTFTGVPSATSTGTFPITANDVVPAESGFLIYGFKKANLNFHGGKLCVKTPFVRTPAKAPKNPGGGCSGWILRRNFNATIQNAGDPALSVGATVFVQWRQRDPADPAGFGDALTDGLRFQIAP